jgi:diacylglycerol kinase (ATP)
MIKGLKAEIARLGNTAKWSWQGWAAAWATEKSLRQWSLVNVASAVLAFSMDLTSAERALILALGMLVLAAELLNTAIEEAVDYMSTDPHPRARKAKDCGSAAVAVTALAAGMVWVVVLIG